MKKILKAVMLPAVALMTVGCATLSQEECEVADWRSIGYEDGMRGHTADRIGEHRKACAEFGVSPDLDGYLAGRDEGLLRYCTERNGYKLGVAGSGYKPVCPEAVESAFRSGYEYGLEVHKLEKELAGLNKAIEKLTAERSLVDEDIASRESEILAESTPVARRLEALKEMREFEADKESIEHELMEAEASLSTLASEVSAMKDRAP